MAHVGLHALGLSPTVSGSVMRSRRPSRGPASVPAARPGQGARPDGPDAGRRRGELRGHRAPALQEDLFGLVPSDTTVFRTFHEITPPTRKGIAQALAEVRAEVWRRSSATTGTAPVVLDIDASLVEIHSENKEGAAPTYKGGYGFHPMFCFADATGEALSSVLRPGNAGANTVADHVRPRRRHRPAARRDRRRPHEGDDSSLVQRGRRARRLGGVHRGVPRGLPGPQHRLLRRRPLQRPGHRGDPRGHRRRGRLGAGPRQDGELREGAAVCELTSLIDDPNLPEGTRLIVRREPLHPGAQRSLFPSLEFRYWGFYTDQAGDPVALDAIMRAHAHVEQHISRLKDSGLLRFPFTSFEANANWLIAVPGGRPRALVPAPLPRRPWQVPDRRRFAGGSSTPRAASSTGLASASCASSTAGRAPRRCSAPTGASRSSPERTRSPPFGTRLTTHTPMRLRRGPRSSNGATSGLADGKITSGGLQGIGYMAPNRSPEFS